MKGIVAGILTVMFLTGCVDVFYKKYWKHGDYYIAINPGNITKTLYHGLPNGDGIGRVDNIISVAVVGDFILAESVSEEDVESRRFWIINMLHDNGYFNADEIVRGPFDTSGFSNLLKEYHIAEPNWKRIE